MQREVGNDRESQIWAFLQDSEMDLQVYVWRVEGSTFYLFSAMEITYIYIYFFFFFTNHEFRKFQKHYIVRIGSSDPQGSIHHIRALQEPGRTSLSPKRAHVQRRTP
jgi:hypothetical protein